MTNGTVVRSMVLNDGYVIALDDGLISWRPSGGRRTNHRLQNPASILLGIKGPTGKCESIIIGDTRGNIIRLSLPKLELLDAFETTSGVVRSICRVSKTHLIEYWLVVNQDMFGCWVRTFQIIAFYCLNTINALQA